MISTEMQARLAALEEKGIVRRVRSAAGVARYNQPLGSIIVRDVFPSPGPRKRRGMAYDAAAAPKKVAPLKSLDDLKWKQSPDSTSSRHMVAKHGRVEIMRVGGFGEEDKNNFTYRLKVDGKQVGNTLGYWKASPSMILKDINLYARMIPAKRKPRDVDSFMDYWDGIYGLDWQYEDDHIVETDFDDPEKRYQIAVKDAQDLGIKVEDGLVIEFKRTVKYSEKYFDPDARETINAVARAYENMYPGFTKYQSTFFMGPDQGGAIAWNGPSRELTPEGNAMTHMGFNHNYWSTSPRDTYVKKLEDQVRNGTASRFFSLEAFEPLAEELGVDPWRLSMLSVINHEMGHTVARMVFGELQNNGIDNQEWREYYATHVTPILMKYGVIDDDMALHDTDTTDRLLTGGGRSSLPSQRWNREALAQHLSRYGSTNVHEMMAETWASFMMDQNPTEFVLELGSMIEELLMTWLEEAE